MMHPMHILVWQSMYATVSDTSMCIKKSLNVPYTSILSAIDLQNWSNYVWKYLYAHHLSVLDDVEWIKYFISVPDLDNFLIGCKEKYNFQPLRLIYQPLRDPHSNLLTTESYSLITEFCFPRTVK